jgi:hypothetical protein
MGRGSHRACRQSLIQPRLRCRCGGNVRADCGALLPARQRLWYDLIPAALELWRGGQSLRAVPEHVARHGMWVGAVEPGGDAGGLRLPGTIANLSIGPCGGRLVRWSFVLPQHPTAAGQECPGHRAAIIYGETEPRSDLCRCRLCDQEAAVRTADASKMRPPNGNDLLRRPRTALPR